MFGNRTVIDSHNVEGDIEHVANVLEINVGLNVASQALFTHEELQKLSFIFDCFLLHSALILTISDKQ